MLSHSKEYFSLTEICNLWSVTMEDLLYFGENNMLEISARSTAVMVELDKKIKNIEELIFHSEGKRSVFSPLALLPKDIYRIFKSKEKPVRIHQLKYFIGEKLTQFINEEGIMISTDDLVVTRAEKIHFEQENEVNLDVRQQREIFKASCDFREIWFYGQRHLFGPLQARIIALLYQASQTGQPWVHTKILLKQSGSESLRLAAVFHSHKTWGEIICSDHKGYYRLRLPPNILVSSIAKQIPLAI